MGKLPSNKINLALLINSSSFQGQTLQYAYFRLNLTTKRFILDYSTMKKILLAAFAVAGSTALSAQTELGVFSATGRGAATPFVTDYHAIGINPANLNLASEFEGKSVTFGLFEGAGSMYSSFLNKEEVRNTIFRNDFRTLNQQERRAYADLMANETTNLNLNIISTGIAVNDEKYGGFAFSTRERISMSSRFGPMASELIFLGRTASYFSELVLMNGDTIANTGSLSADTLNMVDKGIVAPQDALLFSELLDGTSVGFSWTREFNLAYGKRLLKTEDLELHGGIGAKLILGNAWVQVDSDGSNISAFSAMSPVFGVDYGDLSTNNPSSLPGNSPSLKPVGLGWGIDLGATLVFKEKLFLSAAINDIGRIKWDGNLYELNNSLFTEFGDPGAETADLVEEVIAFASPDNLLDWQGASERVTSLPTIARFGAGFVINDKIRLAADAVVPINDNVVNYDSPVIALGADVRPLKFMQLSAGFITGNDRAALIPVGITFIVGGGSYEFGFASRDLVTWFANDNPTLSMSWGFLRFRV